LFTFQREIHVFMPTLSTLAKTLVFAHPSLSATHPGTLPRDSANAAITWPQGVLSEEDS
jgi:hypothetical protein